VHIQRIWPLISPAVLNKESPASEATLTLIDKSRRVLEVILEGRDSCLVVIKAIRRPGDPAARRSGGPATIDAALKVI